MLKVLKNQVTEVKDAMKDNVETLHEREGNLEDLESRATELEENVSDKISYFN
jgi:gas vesicle protein